MAGEPVGMKVDRAIAIWVKALELGIACTGDGRARLQSYEKLVSDPRGESIAICRYLGVVLPHEAFPARVFKHNPLSDSNVALIRAETDELWRCFSELTAL